MCIWSGTTQAYILKKKWAQGFSQRGKRLTGASIIFIISKNIVQEECRQACSWVRVLTSYNVPCLVSCPIEVRDGEDGEGERVCVWGVTCCVLGITNQGLDGVDIRRSGCGSPVVSYLVTVTILLWFGSNCAWVLGIYVLLAVQAPYYAWACFSLKKSKFRSLIRTLSNELSLLCDSRWRTRGWRFGDMI